MTKRTWRAWTDKELDHLESLRLDGLSVAKIAAAMGRTEASIKNRLQQDAIVKPRDSRWLDALSIPHTITDLAQKFGVTKWAVKQAKRRLRRAGVDIDPALPSRYLG